MKTFNYYCDESCHLPGDKMQYMMLGYVAVPYNQLKRHKERIKAIKEKHHYYGEIKWSKVSTSQFDFYQDLIDYFFDTDLSFRAIVIKKEQIANQNFQQDFDTFYYKMYYQLVYHKMDVLNTYNIYLDIKDSLSATKVSNLRDILQTKLGVIRNLQNIHSKESVFMQLTDLLMGAVNYHLRGLTKVKAKASLIHRIQKNSSYSLTESTPKWEDKMNLFFIELK